MTRKPPSDPVQDRALIARVNRGDHAAFERLYLRYRDWVVSLAYRFTGNRDDALDVLQETFAYFLTRFPGFSLHAALTTFFYPVVKNLALGVRRKRRPVQTVDDAALAIPAPAETDPDRIRAELEAVVRVLPEPQREVLLMRFVDGFSLDEIAGALEIPPGTVKSRLHLALEKLRNDPRTRDYFAP
jgi:RNA polymerase sigma-70 factor (ECF subfamily)